MNQMIRLFIILVVVSVRTAFSQISPPTANPTFSLTPIPTAPSPVPTALAISPTISKINTSDTSTWNRHDWCPSMSAVASNTLSISKALVGKVITIGLEAD